MSHSTSESASTVLERRWLPDARVMFTLTLPRATLKSSFAGSPIFTMTAPFGEMRRRHRRIERPQRFVAFESLVFAPFQREVSSVEGLEQRLVLLAPRHFHRPSQHGDASEIREEDRFRALGDIADYDFGRGKNHLSLKFVNANGRTCLAQCQVSVNRKSYDRH